MEEHISVLAAQLVLNPWP